MPAVSTSRFAMETAFLHLSAWIILHITDIGSKQPRFWKIISRSGTAIACFVSPKFAPLVVAIYEPVVKLSIWIG
jgi:hypothetical protein